MAHRRILALLVLSTFGCKVEPSSAPTPSGESHSATSDADPSALRDAAAELAAWLSEPDDAPRPAWVGASSGVELVERCGACDEDERPKISMLADAAAIEARARELADEAPAGALTAEDEIVCEGDCCSFVPDPDFGVGDNVVNLERLCFARAADGTPTAVTRIEVSGSW
jgi:hypothetical protein